MIKIGTSWINHIITEEDLTVDEFRVKYHITELKFQFNSLEDQGYDVYFEDPKHETIFRIKIGI